MSTALTIAVDDKTMEAIESIASQCSLEALAEAGAYKRTFLMAAGINALRRTITDKMVDELMNLQGTSLGFKTDKDTSGGYSRDVVKECAIEVVLRGGYWVGNEFNIIAGGSYLTKNFFARKVREFPGLTDLRLCPGVPVAFGDKTCLVPYVATWLLNGKPDSVERKLTKIASGDLDERISVRVNSMMGPDAVLGKAERKILAAVYKRLTGSDASDGEAEEAYETRSPAKSLDALADKLEGVPERIAAPEVAKPTATFSLDNAGADFSGCTTLSEVNKLSAELEKDGIPEDHRVAVAGYQEQARERITAARTKSKDGKLALNG